MTRTGESLAAGVVIDAGGGRHWLARLLGIGVQRLSPRYVVKYGYVRPGALGRSAGLPEAALFRGDASGWTWIAPVAPDLWHWSRLDFRGRRIPPGWIPRALACGLRCGGSRGSDQTWRMARATAGPGWLLAGDAAVVLDPASSHGVLRAVLTGIQAGRLAGAPSEAGYAGYDLRLREAVRADTAALRRLYTSWRTRALPASPAYRRSQMIT